jgi:hypothetical protein
MCYQSSECGEGTCYAGACVCYPQYTQQGSGEACDYLQLAWSTALWLSLCFGATGADWFFLSRGNPFYIFGGIVKFFGGPVIALAVANNTFRSRIIVCALWYTCAWLFDVLRLLSCNFPDGNGVQLY